MSQNSTEPPKTCAYCEKILRGRSDQRFCNDNCRNTYNRNKRASEKIEEHENTPEIFRIIKRNYEILKRNSSSYGEDVAGFMNTADFLALGINPKFFTSVVTDKKGQQWCCVFEICFSMGETLTLIKDFPEQANLNG